MAAAAQAALLDELMGKGRNVSLSEAKPPHWSDDDMCKYFLAGLCPNDLFNNTKDDLGPCEKVHDDSLIEKYRKSKRFGEMRYEEKLCSYLRDLISTVESRIRRGETRLQRNGNLVHSFYNCEREEVLLELTGKIEETLAKVEKLGNDGEVAQSQKWLDVAEKLINEKGRLEKNIEIYNQQAKELEICKICGAFQVKGDAHQRIEEHLQGKMHLGYAQIREYLDSHVTEKDKGAKDDKGNKSQSGEKKKTMIDDDPKDRNKDNEHKKEYLKSKGKEPNNEKERYNDNEHKKQQLKCKDREQNKEKEKHREQVKVKEKSIESDNEWNKEQCKVTDRYKDNSKERRRKRSVSKTNHHSDSKRSHRDYDYSKYSTKNSTSQRRSKSSKRYVYS